MYRSMSTRDYVVQDRDVGDSRGHQMQGGKEREGLMPVISSMNCH